MKRFCAIQSREMPQQLVIDDITRKMAYAMSHGQCRVSEKYTGFYCCFCGATTDGHTYEFQGRQTSSLVIHDLAFHREQVSAEDLELVSQMQGQQEPSESELVGIFFDLHDPQRIHLERMIYLQAAQSKV
jgi:hypothetical protein